MNKPQPDYRRLVAAAKNRRPERIPLYEHIIDDSVMEAVLDEEFAEALDSDPVDYFQHYVEFFRTCGYDTVSFECLITEVLPGAGALYRHTPGCIGNREDFERYPWDEIADRFFERYRGRFEALRAVMPEGMKAVGGPGNGVFECAQDLVGYSELCLLRTDDPELYGRLFSQIGELFARIWRRFLAEFGDLYAVCRFGDDLGFKSSLLLPPDDVRKHLIPQYARVVDLVHEAGKPFLLHSCGNIFEVMDDIIDGAGIDAKHSNEDTIARIDTWIERYGGRIGVFGGIDTDVLCGPDREEIARYVERVYGVASSASGFAIGSGNSIPDYVPVDGYLTMVNEVRRLRGD